MRGDQQNKYRLYLTLHDGNDSAGCHWAIWLMPKSDSDVNDSTKQVCYRFQATNSSCPGQVPAESGAWRSEGKRSDPLRSRDMVARLLVAKLPCSEGPLMDWAERIHNLICGGSGSQGVLPLQVSNAEWVCRVWTEQALGALRTRGGAFITIPDIVQFGKLEERIHSIGEEAKVAVRGPGKIFRGVQDLKFVDLRVK